MTPSPSAAPSHNETAQPIPGPIPRQAVTVNKLVRADRARVFAAWTQAEQIKQWWCPGPSVTCGEVVVELRVGGTFRVAMQSERGPMTGSGRFLEIVPGERLVFSWSWLEAPDFGADSEVTVQLYDADNPYDDDVPGTEIVLTHARLATAAERNDHLRGWTTILVALGYFVRGAEPPAH